MIKTLLAISITTLSIIALANDNPGGKMSTDQQTVLNVIERMTAAFQKGDIEGVMASYEAKATVIFEPGKPVSDSAVLRNMFKGAFTLNPTFSYSGHEVFVSDDIAVHYAPWTMKGKAPDGGNIEQNGLSVAVLRRQPDGQWLMVIDNPHGQHLMDR